ncbi:hypothetical protein [Lacticaseibacillus jixiensis]|uniref:hypothetical protein n=1 Tax=Lacticaseibacillus jixiensis TaxID=3231926 RepID=UPI0036F1F165
MKKYNKRGRLRTILLVVVVVIVIELKFMLTQYSPVWWLVTGGVILVWVIADQILKRRMQQ